MMRTSLLSLSTKIGQIHREENEKLEEEKSLLIESNNIRQTLKSIQLLIGVTYDISLITDVHFKEQFLGYEHLFGAAFNDMLATNNLVWIYKFSKNNKDLLKANMNALIKKVIEINIPAYMYSVAVKFDDIPTEDMKHLIVAIVASKDRKYIDYLVLTLKEKGMSNEIKEFISTLGIFIDANNFINYDDTLADKLEKSLLEDDYETLNKLGIACEDGTFVFAKV